MMEKKEIEEKIKELKFMLMKTYGLTEKSVPQQRKKRNSKIKNKT